LDDQDFFFFDLYFSTQGSKLNEAELVANAFTLDSSSEEEDEYFLAEHAYSVPDDFYFDDFFVDNYIILLFLSFLFFPFAFYVLAMFLFIILFTNNFLQDEEEDEEHQGRIIFNFLEDEADISHYSFSQFHFVEFPELDYLFYTSGF